MIAHRFPGAFSPATRVSLARLMIMRVFVGHLLLCALVLCAGAGPSTQPATITLKGEKLPLKQVIAELAKQNQTPLPVSPPDVLDRNDVGSATLDLHAVPFWKAIEELGKQTGLEPILNGDDPYPRFQLGYGAGFWDEPHVIAGPLVIFANEIRRTNTVELARKNHKFDRELTLHLTAFAQPGLRLLSVSEEIKLREAIDDKGRNLMPAGASTDPSLDPPSFTNPGGGLYSWNLAIVLHSPQQIGQKITRIKGQTHLRVQTRGEKYEIEDVMKVRNVTRNVAGVPFTFNNLKKADIEYVMRLTVRRDKLPQEKWNDIHQSIYNGMMVLYDANGRLVASHATENGGDYGGNKIDATLRFVREPGISDPNAGEPHKLVWFAPTESAVIPVDFELTDLPIPE